MKYIEKHPILMILVGICGISASAIFVRYSVAPSAVLAAWRLLWSVILMTPVVLMNPAVRRELAAADKKSALLSALSGVFLAAHFILWFDSLQKTSVASAATLVCTEVIWVSFGFCLFLKGRIGKNAAFAIAVTLLGSVIIALADSGAGEGHLEGDILAVLAAVCSAVYMLFGRSAQKKLSTTVYTYLVYGSCALVLLAVCLVQNTGLLASGVNPVVVGFLLALFSTILGHTIFSWALKFYSPSFVSACKLMEPVGAGILAIFLFGEIPAPMALLGGALILGGVWYYSRIEKRA
jgi:drug/metabolite transporter (DMT)-like permease